MPHLVGVAAGAHPQLPDERQLSLIQKVDGEHSAGGDEVVGVICVVDLDDQPGAMQDDRRGSNRHRDLGIHNIAGADGHRGQWGAQPGKHRPAIGGVNIRGRPKHLKNCARWSSGTDRYQSG